MKNIIETVVNSILDVLSAIIAAIMCMIACDKISQVQRQSPSRNADSVSQIDEETAHILSLAELLRDQKIRSDNDAKRIAALAEKKRIDKEQIDAANKLQESEFGNFRLLKAALKNDASAVYLRVACDAGTFFWQAPLDEEFCRFYVDESMPASILKSIHAQKSPQKSMHYLTRMIQRQVSVLLLNRSNSKSLNLLKNQSAFSSAQEQLAKITQLKQITL
ncbi:MAG: hypothetical protein H7252_02415 [Cytophaga sp.]|nr:hypothetical protein [Undibacterium sp.]